MDNYLLMGHILRCKIIPKDQVHPELWVGANRKWRTVPKDRIARVEHNKVALIKKSTRPDVFDALSSHVLKPSKQGLPSVSSRDSSNVNASSRKPVSIIALMLLPMCVTLFSLTCIVGITRIVRKSQHLSKYDRHTVRDMAPRFSYLGLLHSGLVD